MINTAPILEPGSPEWHADRRLGVGGSESAAAIGMSKWKSPYQLYCEKIGDAEPQDETWDMARGKAMEGLLRQHFANTFNVEVLLPVKSMVSEKYPWMRYNPDGFAGNVLAELKTARYSTGWGTAGTDEVPTEYLIQCQHGLIVTGLEIARPSVSIAYGEPVYYEVPFDKELAEMIIDGTHAFWQHVLDRNPPDAKTNEDCARKFRNVTGKEITVSDDAMNALIHLRGTRESIKELEARKEQLEVIIKNHMAGFDTLVDLTGNALCTWKQQAGAKRIDGDMLRKDYPDVAAAVTKQGDPQRRFLVK